MMLTARQILGALKKEASQLQLRGIKHEINQRKPTKTETPPPRTPALFALKFVLMMCTSLGTLDWSSSSLLLDALLASARHLSSSLLVSFTGASCAAQCTIQKLMRLVWHALTHWKTLHASSRTFDQHSVSFERSIHDSTNRNGIGYTSTSPVNQNEVVWNMHYRVNLEEVYDLNYKCRLQMNIQE